MESSAGLPHDLCDMMVHVIEVIGNDEPQRDRRGFSDAAERREAVFRNAFDHGGNELVAVMPLREQRGPGHGGVIVHAHPFVLGVSGTFEVPRDGGVRDADVIVGRGVEQMAENFFAQPSAWPVRYGSLSLGNGGEPLMSIADAVAKFLAEILIHGSMVNLAE